MNEADRIKVLRHINGDDAPSIGEWCPQAETKTVSKTETEEAGRQIRKLLQNAGPLFQTLEKDFQSLGEFLSRLAVLVMKETDGDVKLDGRRLGFMYRSLLANRAVEISRTSLWGEELPVFAESAKQVILASIPMGLNEEGINRENMLHKAEICLDLLSDYFSEGGNFQRVETVYRLFTTTDLFEKAEILLGEDLSEMVKLKAWNDLCAAPENITPLAYIALKVESIHPGKIPSELLEKVGGAIEMQNLQTETIPGLTGSNIELIESVEALLDQPDDLRRMIAYETVRGLAACPELTQEFLAQTTKRITATAEKIEGLLNKTKHESEK